MFLELPITLYDENESTTLDECFLNPSHIVSICTDPEDKAFCIATDITGYSWYIRLSKAQLRTKLKEFLKTNVLQKIYSEQKKNGS